jgi:hypothetical protein
MNRGVLLFLVFALMFGALFTFLVNLYLAQQTCTCEMVKNHECVP